MKRSALYHLHERAQAEFAECHGWSIPFSFISPESEVLQVRERVGLTDLSYRTKFDTKAEPEQPFWRLAANHYLVVGEPPLDPPSGSTDVTGVYANLFLAGPQSRAVLGKLMSLNVSNAALPNLGCTQASLAHVHSIVLREDLASIPGFHLLISREYGESLWEAILHAGQEFHLQPFGLGALALLRN
jgi:glycine cleavage system aminomethyltransferase T